MTPETINAHVSDLPDGGLLPQKDSQPVHKRSEYTVSEILCSAAKGHPLGMFAACRTTAGKCVGVWECHADLFATEEEMRKALNKAELELLTYKAHLA